MSEVFKVKCSNSKVRPPTTREGKKLKTAQRQGYWTTGAVICDVVDKKCVWWERDVLLYWRQLYRSRLHVEGAMQCTLMWEKCSQVGGWEKRKASPELPRVPELSGGGAKYSQGGKNKTFTFSQILSHFKRLHVIWNIYSCIHCNINIKTSWSYGGGNDSD